MQVRLVKKYTYSNKTTNTQHPNIQHSPLLQPYFILRLYQYQNIRKIMESRWIRTLGSSWPTGMNLQTDGLWSTISITLVSFIVGPCPTRYTVSILIKFCPVTTDYIISINLYCTWCLCESHHAPSYIWCCAWIIYTKSLDEGQIGPKRWQDNQN